LVAGDQRPSAVDFAGDTILFRSRRLPDDRPSFPTSWSVFETTGYFVVQDATGRNVAWFYFRDDPTVARSAAVLLKEQARRRAVNFAGPLLGGKEGQLSSGLLTQVEQYRKTTSEHSAMIKARYHRDQAELCREMARQMSDRNASDVLCAAAARHFARALELEKLGRSSGQVEETHLPD
jgi:hypothetical protein